MYVFACGEACVPDVSPWSPGVNVGKSTTFSDNCYLIVHGKDLMMWDSGYPDAMINSPDGVVGPRSTAYVKKTLTSQLAELGIKPAQITRVAFSHIHGDHVGNANLFANAIVYIQQPEFDAAFGVEPSKFGFVPATYEQLRTNPIVKLNGDYDVFGDGSVTILSTPRHTPGHQSLLVRLPKTGAVVLSGDVAHFKEKSPIIVAYLVSPTRSRASNRWTSWPTSWRANTRSCGSITTRCRAQPYRTRRKRSIDGTSTRVVLDGHAPTTQSSDGPNALGRSNNCRRRCWAADMRT